MILPEIKGHDCAGGEIERRGRVEDGLARHVAPAGADVDAQAVSSLPSMANATGPVTRSGRSCRPGSDQAVLQVD